MLNTNLNINLNRSKREKNDEFYTQYSDIENEITAYVEYNPNVFRGKTVYCNCDDPFESNFFRYFVLNFNKFGLKQLITTSYKPSPVANAQRQLFGDDKTLAKVKDRPKITANKFIVNEVKNINENGKVNLKDIVKQLKANKHNEWSPLDGNGDFRSLECTELLKQSDVVVTNPPFSLFREYVKQLFDYDKDFLIMGNMNAITYKRIFPLIKNNKMWIGQSIISGDIEFQIPDYYPLTATGWRIDYEGRKFVRVTSVRWFTNLDHHRRHEVLSLLTMAENRRFNKKVRNSPVCYKRYDNYDAIEVSFVDAIPSDYSGIMGVPVSFLDKYNPEQFEIVGLSRHDNQNMDGGCWKGGQKDATLNGKQVYRRILIKHKKNHG